jgi:hypothetical protein
MPLFGPPNVERLKVKHAVEGLIKALNYASENPNSPPVCSHLCGVLDSFLSGNPLLGYQPTGNASCSAAKS